jgi:hypothetical protein
LAKELACEAADCFVRQQGWHLLGKKISRILLLLVGFIRERKGYS